MVVVLGTLVLLVTVDTSETGVGLDEVTVAVTVDDSVVASVVSVVGVIPVVAGPTAALVVCATEVDLDRVVVVKSGLVEEVNQNSDVMAEGALLVLDVLGPNGMMVELAVLVVSVAPVDGASVSLTVDSGSTTSGLPAGRDVEGDRCPVVL